MRRRVVVCQCPLPQGTVKMMLNEMNAFVEDKGESGLDLSGHYSRDWSECRRSIKFYSQRLYVCRITVAT